MRSILYYILFALYTLLCFIPFTLLFFITVGFDKERVILHWASRIWSRGIFGLCPWWHVRVEGAEKIDPSRTWVIITNHQSVLDIPLMYVLPTTFKWVSKKEVQKFPIFGWVLRMHGDILVERGSRHSAKQMLTLCRQRLGRGTSVIVFPEGTRSQNGQVGHFKDGAFFVAKEAGVGIQPVAMDGTGTLNQGWKLVMPHTIRVKVLDPLTTEYVASRSVKELAGEMETLIGNEQRILHEMNMKKKV